MRPLTLLAPAAALVLGLTVVAPAGADPQDPPGSKASPTGQDHRAERAEEALADVEALIAGHGQRRTGAAAHAHGRSLSPALHELRLTMDALSPADRERALQILQRPGEPGDEFIPGPLPLVTCSTDVCIHYTESGNDAPDGSDGNPGTVPPYIVQVRDTVQQVHTDFVNAGYRQPKSDGAIGGGGSGLTDIYIGDIGDGGLYGACTSDDPNNPTITGDWSVWSYCILDDDYAADEFPTNTSLENMQVTAAHEYFHAVQFAYDGFEDGWLFESTAAWVEDELFDSVDDNRQYLANSPMRTPQIPIDQFGNNYHYGVWIFWRYLTEKYPTSVGGLPTLVRDVWRRVDGTPGAPDDYSTQGLRAVLAARGTSLAREFALFSAANRHPKSVYDEGGSSAYRPSPALTVGIRAGRPNPPAFGGRIDHLAAGTIHFVPRRLRQRDWSLRLAFNLQNVARGSAAVVTVYKRGGGISTSLVRLNSSGGATKTVAFSSRKVSAVDVTLVNASGRFTCWEGTVYSCQGVPRDDNLLQVVDPKAFRR